MSGKMDLIHTKAFLSPLSGFLILPSSTQEERSKTLSCNLDDLPRLYVIGNIQNVNKKISQLELGLRRYDSSDVVIEDMMQRKYAGLKGPRKGRRISKQKEKDQAVTQRYGRLGSDAGTLRNQKKIAQKKMITEKNKLVELYHYPGYHEEELTPLPNGIELNEILKKVIRAQSKTAVGKTKWAMKMLHRFFDVPCTQAVLLDSFWWQFLHLYHPNQEIQGHLFQRIAENYALILLGRASNQECILTFFPSLLCQAVYICFCSCFPRSWFNTSEFKAQLCDVFFEWLGGTLREPRSFFKWDYSQLEPERSRREDLMSRKKKLGTGTGISFESYKQYSAIGKTHLQKIPSRKTFNLSIKTGKKSVSGKKGQKQLSKKVTALESEEIKHTTSSSDQLKEDNEKAAWSRHQNLPQKKLKIAMLPRESHPACNGPDFTWHRFNINGHSPLIQHYFQKHGTESKSGCDIFLSRREIYKPMPDSVKTYAEVIKENFHIVHQKHKAFRKCYWQRYREMRKFDEQNKRNQELYREAIKEEMKKRKAQKQKELLSLRDRQNSSEPSSLFSKDSSRKHQDQVVQEELGYQDEEESFFQDIDLLQKHGINVADIKKLKSVGICTIKGIQMTTKRALCNVKGLSEAKVEKIKEAANKLIEPGFLTAFEYSEKRKMVFHITTGSQEFDKLLGGGIESMAITEAFGEFRTGKTQLSHTLCVTAQLPGADGYTGGKIIFIDTENTFRPDRLRDIADRFNADHEAVLDNVLYARAYTSEHQMELLDYVAGKFHEEPGIFKLLIIDSIMALFRVDFSGRGELAERQQKLAQMLSRLQKISEEYNVAVFVTNQMTSDPGATMTFQADPKKPIGGHILAHASTTRISLRKGRGELRIAKIYDSPEMPENEATFAITAGGIGDAKE